MKTLLLGELICLMTLTGQAQTPPKPAMAHQAQLKEKIALACKLTDKEQIRRMNELHQSLFKKVTRTVDHPNSYELVFDKSDASLLGELAEFITFERLCCPWLLFQLSVQPGEGPISLAMGDSAETKKMVYLVMELDKLQKPGGQK